MPSQPLDYAAYNRILSLATLRKSLRPGLTVEEALRSIAHEQPWWPEYAQAYQRYTGRQPARAAVTKVAPARPLCKAEASAPPAYEEIRLQGDALFRTGQAGSTWEGMGQYASSHPDIFQAYVEECRRVNGQPDARLAKARPTAEAAPQRAIDALMAQIAKRQAEDPGLSFVAAADRVNQEDPALHERYLMEMRYPQLRPRPVAKAAPLTYEQILKTVKAQVAQQPSLSRREALMALVQKHPHEQAYHDAYRRFHLTDGLQEHHAAPVAKRQARS